MEILPIYIERIAALPPAQPIARQLARTPKAKSYYHNTVRYVQGAADADAVAQLASELSLSCIGIDTEFRYDSAPVMVERGNSWHDPRSVHPLLLSLALIEDGENIYPVVFDLRAPAILPALQAILRLPVRFVGHYLKAELFCLWQLGLTEPANVWDTWVAEYAADLGRNNVKYQTPRLADVTEQIQAQEKAEEHVASAYSLVGTCQRHGVAYRLAGDKERLQQSFLTHADGASFTQEQIEYSALDAIAAAEVYFHQVGAAAVSGLGLHLERVEMPWVTTNARIEWHGVKADPEKCRVILDAAQRHGAAMQVELRKYGIENANSHPQVEEFFERAGLLELFHRDGKYSFDRKQLKSFHHHHPAIKFLYVARLIQDMRKSGVFDLRFVGRDGRLHPVLKQLGTDTGRCTTKCPNILGLSRAQRPVIVAEKGCGIGEVDLSQIEVGIAAAVYNDGDLIKMWNSGDVYSAMAQSFHREELTEEDHALSGKLFKKKFGHLRDQMKICTLGILFGMTPHGIGNQLNCSAAKAAQLQGRFMAMFPALRQALQDAPQDGALRGHVSTVSGLRRHRVGQRQPSSWERNWMTNHPVQGSAAVVFKAAGNRLDRLYQQYSARLIVAFHDAYVFEAPLEHLNAIAQLTADEMIRAVQEWFPMLRPKVDTNIARPECWNKDGCADSWRRWVDDPMAVFEADVGQHKQTSAESASK